MRNLFGNSTNKTLLYFISSSVTECKTENSAVWDDKAMRKDCGTLVGTMDFQNFGCVRYKNGLNLTLHVLN